MAEIWGMVGAAAIGVVGGAMSGRAAQKGQKEQIAADKEIAKIQGQEQRKTTAFEADLVDYYSQLNTQRRRDARGSMYDKYSVVQKPEGYQRQALVGAKPVSPGSTTTTGATPNAVPRAQQIPVLNQPTP